MRISTIIVSLILVFIAYNITTANTTSGPSPLDTEQVSFMNVTYDVGLQGVGGQFLAWGDYNNDGNQDILVNGRRLFKNNGDPDYNFTEVTGQVGISGGSYGTWADWNNDGYLDFFCAGSDKLYKNNGPPDYDFSDVTGSSGIMQESHSTGCGWGDYDNDGDVDLFKIRGEDWDAGIYFPNSFWRNNGDGTFTNVTVDAGVDEYSDPKYSRGVAWADYNDDGWLDIYISNYRQLDNYLYENNGDGTFTDVAPEKGVADAPSHETGNPDPFGKAGHSVGAVWGDFDNDGYLDLWVTNLNHKDSVRTSDDSLLYRNSGPPDFTFTNMRGSSGIPIKPIIENPLTRQDELFVGCAWGDYDMDGDLDLYLPQIYDISYAYSFLYMNNGDGTFTDVTTEANVRVWDTYAGCWCDYDNDGDLDLITSGRDSGGNADPHFVHLFRNEITLENWLHLNLKGDGFYTNTAAIGARVTVTTDLGDSQVKEVSGGGGPHGHQNSLVQEFGLGAYSGTVDVEIRWSDGSIQIIEDVITNKLLNITESKGDLIVTEISIDEDHPITGDNVLISATVKNIGPTHINTAEVKIYLDEIDDANQIPPTRTITNIPSDSETTTSIPWDTEWVSGSHTLYARAEIIDPPYSGPTSAKSLIIFIRAQNELPVANLSADPSSTDKGGSVSFDAENSTDDTQVTEYFFDFGDGEASGWITETKIDHIYYNGGDYTASLTVRDEDEGESINTEELTIEVYAKPKAVLTANITEIYKGESITFNGSQSTDEGGTVEEFNFDFGDGESSGWITQSSVSHQYNSAGQFSASLVVRDNHGNTSDNPEIVTIDINAKPHAVLLANTTSIVISDSVMLDASESSDDDGSVKWFYFVFGDGDKSGWVIDDKINHSYNREGFFTASLTVRDDEDDESENTAEIIITVTGLPNKPPTATIDYIDPNPALSGMEITFRGSGRDEDGNIAGYQWNSDIEGLLSSSWSFSTSVLSVGTHMISFKVQDDDLTWSTEATEILIVKDTNQKPTVEIISPDDGERVSGILTISGTATDLDGEVVEVQIRIDDGAWESAQGTSDWSFQLDTNLYSKGEHIITVRASDGEENSEEISFSIVIFQKGEDGDEDPPAFLIIGLVVIVILVVLVLSFALGMPPKKKEEHPLFKPVKQYPQNVQPPPKQPGNRWNW
ncbi:MAG: VCBS repeat-containing protein [Thermoplasmata archaeon]|nr:MAG: VCBS repeat-containing protein [Thermoplasmata archaeon]